MAAMKACGVGDRLEREASAWRSTRRDQPLATGSASKADDDQDQAEERQSREIRGAGEAEPAHARTASA